MQLTSSIKNTPPEAYSLHDDVSKWKGLISAYSVGLTAKIEWILPSGSAKNPVVCPHDIDIGSEIAVAPFKINSSY